MLLCAVLAGASGVEAQKRQAQPDPYLAVIQDALVEFDAGNYAEARVLFAQAHGMKPSARTLRGMGMTSFELKEYVRAEQELNAALVDLRQPLSEAQRKEILALLLRLERYIGKLEIKTKPPSATVTLDGSKVSGVFKVELGRHELVVQAPGHQTVNRSVNVEGGKTQVIEVSLPVGDSNTIAEAPAPQPAAPAADVVLATTPKDTNPYVVERRSIFEEWWFWTVVGVVVAGGVTAAVVLNSRERTESAVPGNTGHTIQVLSWSQR